MRLLFDTHTFIWWSDAPEQLTPKVLAACRNKSNQLFLSIATIWEMQIKLQLGKLQLKLPLEQMVDGQLARNRTQLLAVTTEHVYGLGDLSHHHRDPFDRLLIAQCMVENMVFLSNDDIVDQYPVQRLWQ